MPINRQEKPTVKTTSGTQLPTEAKSAEIKPSADDLHFQAVIKQSVSSSSAESEFHFLILHFTTVC